jgi:methylenetetrahydrofolate--tRNA-(uracil-5-)-methyltransferase
VSSSVTVVGAGLAGCELSWQLAERGIEVTLIEQKPLTRTPAQTSDELCELVCSNSFRGAALTNAVGLIKEEMRRAGSLVMAVGARVRVPAGGAFAVDRERFAAEMGAIIRSHPRIRVEARLVDRIPDARPCVIATGPLTGDALARDLARVVGEDQLAYYDAIAPIVEAASIDETKTFRQSRYDKGDETPGMEAAYLNCPFSREEYEAFVAAICAAEKVEPRAFEKIRYFEGCLPVEVMAERGVQTLAFGPMKPVGLTDPRTGKRPYAVVQLRPEDLDRSAYNIVGFQTRMKWPEQKRVFSMIPGLEQAELLRFGSVHRNTFVDAPRVLDDTLALKNLPGVHLAGQITGVEGYVESAACGMLVAFGLAAALRGGRFEDALPPSTTALGAMYRHLRTPSERFQPSNVVFSMFPPIDVRLKKRARYEALANRALADLPPYLARIGAREVVSRLPAAPVLEAAS